MKLKLLRNVMSPDFGGFGEEIVFSPPILPEMAQALIRQGAAVELPEPTPAHPANPHTYMGEKPNVPCNG